MADEVGESWVRKHLESQREERRKALNVSIRFDK